MDEPQYRVWMQDSAPPATHYQIRNGHWVAEPSWPSQHIQNQRLYLDGKQLTEQSGDPKRISIHTPQTMGLAKVNGVVMGWILIFQQTNGKTMGVLSYLRLNRLPKL